MTVYQNMAFGLENMRHAAGRDRRARCDGAARMLQLDTLLAAASRRSSPAASASASRSAARSCASRRSSCSTSRCRTSTPSCACRCAPRLRALHARLGDDDDLRHARSGRGDDAWPTDRRAARRARRAGRHAARALQPPGNRFVAGFIGSPRMNFLAAAPCSHGADGPALVLDAGASNAVPAGARGRDCVEGDRRRHPAGACRHWCRRRGGHPDRLRRSSASSSSARPAFPIACLPTASDSTVQSAGQAVVAPRRRGCRVAMPHSRLHVFDAETGRSCFCTPVRDAPLGSARHSRRARDTFAAFRFR